MVTYYYSISEDFNGNLREAQLYSEITTEPGITSNLSAVNTRGDIVEIIFDSVLSGSEQTTLVSLISSHVPSIVKSKEKFYVINPKHSSIKTSTWFIAGSFKYGGSNTIGTIDYFELSSYMDSGITSYDVRIINQLNGEILAQKTANTNTSSIYIDLGTISNVPTSSTTLELQVKKTGGNNNHRVELGELVIYYGNDVI